MRVAVCALLYVTSKLFVAGNPLYITIVNGKSGRLVTLSLLCEVLPDFAHAMLPPGTSCAAVSRSAYDTV